MEGTGFALAAPRPRREAASRAGEAISRVLQWECAPEDSELVRSVAAAIDAEFEAEARRRRKRPRSSKEDVGGAPIVDGPSVESEAPTAGGGGTQVEGGTQIEGDRIYSATPLDAEEAESVTSESSDEGSDLSFVTSDSEEEVNSQDSWTESGTCSETSSSSARQTSESPSLTADTDASAVETGITQ